MKKLDIKIVIILFLISGLSQYCAFAQTVEVYFQPETTSSVQHFKFEIGGTLGLFSGATGVSGEMRFPLHLVFGPATPSFRLSSGLMQSEDASRRYVPVQIDGILNYPVGWFTGVENYLGAGINYVLLTSGRIPGSLGAEFFYGVESKGFGGRIFGELGYGTLNTGVGASQSGVTVLVGYRREWGF